MDRRRRYQDRGLRPGLIPPAARIGGPTGGAAMVAFPTGRPMPQ